MDYRKIVAIGLIGAVLASPRLNVYASGSAIRGQGNIVFDQEDAGVAFYESDIRYLENEIEILKSQL